MSTGILLFATLRWQIAARLASVLGDLGYRVATVCPSGHPVASMRRHSLTYPYRVSRPLPSLRKAIQANAPDLIIPCDDAAAMDLYRLNREIPGAGAADRDEAALIKRSLGSPEACAQVTARGRMAELALGEGIRVPDTRVLGSTGDLDDWLSKHACPQVLKLDGSWGGLGVSIVHSPEDAHRALAAKMAGPSLFRAAMRSVLDRDAGAWLNALGNERRTVTIQDYVQGTPANRAVACSRGKVLAGVSVVALNTLHQTGPATVVKVIENAEMADAAARMIGRLGVSGLWGFDFMLDADSGAAWLIEINPRATPICHLSMRGRPQLPMLLCRSLAGEPAIAAPGVIGEEVIAMFPGEWRRDPASPWLQAAYHDVPWDEPGLVWDGIAPPWEQRGMLARLKNRLRPRRLHLTLEVPKPLARGERALEATMIARR